MIKVRLEELLGEKGHSQYWLSQQSGIDNKTLRRLRTDAKGINFETLEKLCETFECSPGDILVLAERESE